MLFLRHYIALSYDNIGMTVTIAGWGGHMVFHKDILLSMYMFKLTAFAVGDIKYESNVEIYVGRYRNILGKERKRR